MLPRHYSQTFQLYIVWMRAIKARFPNNQTTTSENEKTEDHNDLKTKFIDAANTLETMRDTIDNMCNEIEEKADEMTKSIDKFVAKSAKEMKDQLTDEVIDTIYNTNLLKLEAALDGMR